MSQDLADCYGILDLEPGASPEEVRCAYTDLVKVWHPDRYQQESPRLRKKAEEKLKAINSAYERIRSGRPLGPVPQPAPARPQPSPFEDPRHLRPARFGELWGYVDAYGRLAVRAEFEEADEFHEGLAQVVVTSLSGRKRTGYINGRGEFVIPPQFLCSKRFSEGLAAAVISIKWGFVNQEGSFVIHPEFEAASEFRQGTAAVMQRGRWGIIDREGRYLAAPRFDSAEPFDGEWARIAIADRRGRISRRGEIFLEDTPREVGE